MAPRLGGDFDLPTPIFENETRYRLYSLGLTETAPAPLGWIPDLSIAFKSGIAAVVVLADFASFVVPPSGAAPTVYPDGFRGFQYDYAYAAPGPAALQQFAGFQPRGAVASTSNTAVNWQTVNPDIFKRQFPAEQQLFAVLGMRGVPIVVGWEGLRLDYLFAKPIAAALQQYQAFGQPITIPANTKVHGWQNISPERIAAVYPVALQQFSALGLPAVSTVIPTPQGGHGDWPRQLKKKVRPVWDRRPDPYPTPAAGTAEPAPATPIAGADPVLATPVAAPSGPIDVSGLQRLFNPPLAKSEAATKKNRKARRAEARAALAPVIPAALLRADLLEDIDTGSAEITVFTGARVELVETDSGHAICVLDIAGHVLLVDDDRSAGTGTVANLAHGAVIEDADQLFAEASWDDDDIAMLLLGAAPDSGKARSPSGVTRKSAPRTPPGGTEDNDQLTATASWNDDDIALQFLLGTPREHRK